MPVRIGLDRVGSWDVAKEIRRYEEEPLPEAGQIVFYGPSYFTRWDARYGMRPLCEELVGASGAPSCVNRGFGSSCPEHQLYYYDRLVRPLQPKVLVYASFANSMDYGYPPEETFELCQRVVAYAKADFPDVRVYLLGTVEHQKIIPIAGHDEAAAKYDAWLKEFAEATEHCFFVDPKSFPPLLRKDIFVEDGVHYNAEGYRLFGDFFREVLKDELKAF